VPKYKYGLYRIRSGHDYFAIGKDLTWAWGTQKEAHIFNDRSLALAVTELLNSRAGAVYDAKLVRIKCG
jgi:hypothetical protein